MIVSVALLWTQSWQSMSFFCWSLNLLAAILSLQPTIQFAFCAASSHCQFEYFTVWYSAAQSTAPPVPSHQSCCKFIFVLWIAPAHVQDLDCICLCWTLWYLSVHTSQTCSRWHPFLPIFQLLHQFVFVSEHFLMIYMIYSLEVVWEDFNVLFFSLQLLADKQGPHQTTQHWSPHVHTCYQILWWNSPVWILAIPKGFTWKTSQISLLRWSEVSVLF